MIRQNKKMLLLTSIITLLPVFIGLFLWNQLPDSVATHFGLNNQPDGYSSKAFAVFGLPLILLAVQLLSYVHRYNTASSIYRSVFMESVARFSFSMCGRNKH